MTKLDAEIVVALADNNLSIYRTAKAVFLSRGSVTYHARKIKGETGKDPRIFYDLVELLPVARNVLKMEE